MLTFSLVNTPGRVQLPTRVNFLIVSRPFECNHTLSCPAGGWVGCGLLVVEENDGVQGRSNLFKKCFCSVFRVKVLNPL